MSASDPSMLPKPILASRGPSTYEPSPKGLGRPASILALIDVSLAGGTRPRDCLSLHCGIAITVPRAGAFLTGLATALGPGSRR